MRPSEEERRRIELHRKVAPPIPQLRKIKSLKGQLEIDFDGLSVASKSSGCNDPLDNTVEVEAVDPDTPNTMCDKCITQRIDSKQLTRTPDLDDAERDALATVALDYRDENDG